MGNKSRKYLNNSNLRVGGKEQGQTKVEAIKVSEMVALGISTTIAAIQVHEVTMHP